MKARDKVPQGHLEIPGNSDGPLGIDKRMYSWLSANWIVYCLTGTALKQFMQKYPKSRGPPVPALCCRLNYEACRNGTFAIPWMGDEPSKITCKRRKKSECSLDIYRKRFASTISEVEDCSKFDKTLGTSKGNFEMAVDEINILSDPLLENGSSCKRVMLHDVAKLDGGTDKKNKLGDPNIPDIRQCVHTDFTQISLTNESKTSADSDVKILEQSPASEIKDEKSGCTFGRRTRKRPQLHGWLDEYRRTLCVLRASLMFLSVRLDRFTQSRRDDRMSTCRLIEWLVVELGLGIDPREIRPISNIRKELNEEYTRETASALCLQMSLNNGMIEFKNNCGLSGVNNTRCATNEVVEETLTTFYRTFQSKLKAHIMSGQPLIENNVDLRSINLDDYEIYRKTTPLPFYTWRKSI